MSDTLDYQLWPHQREMIRLIEDEPIPEWDDAPARDRWTNVRVVYDGLADVWLPDAYFDGVLAYDQAMPIIRTISSNYTQITKGPLPPWWRRLGMRWWRGRVFRARRWLADRIDPYDDREEWGEW